MWRLTVSEIMLVPVERGLTPNDRQQLHHTIGRFLKQPFEPGAQPTSHAIELDAVFM